MFFFMARDRHALTMTLKSFGEDERWSCGIPFEFHAALGKHGQAQEKRIGRQGAARFYEACGLSPATTEGAIKVRNEVSTAIANRDETAAGSDLTAVGEIAATLPGHALAGVPARMHDASPTRCRSALVFGLRPNVSKADPSAAESGFARHLVKLGFHLSCGLSEA
jgi:hypothetical protein